MGKKLSAERKAQISAERRAYWASPAGRERRAMLVGRGAHRPNQSVSTPSKHSKASSVAGVPQPLPERPERPRMSAGEAEEVIARLTSKAEGLTLLQPTNPATETMGNPGRNEQPEGFLRKRHHIPSDPDKRKRKLSFARIPARVPAQLVGELARAFSPTNGLSPDEHEELIEAWAAVVYFYGLSHPLVGAILCSIGVVIPRVVDWLEDRRRVAKGGQPLDRSRYAAEAAEKKVKQLEAKLRDMESQLARMGLGESGNGVAVGGPPA